MEKLIRRLIKLPLAHIDTSIILESQKTEDGYQCKKLLNMIGMKYRGKLSLVALGELFLDIMSLEDYSERQDAVEFIFGLIREKKIEYGTITNALDKASVKINNIDSRLEQADRLILASASEDRADYLVTLDKKLIRNEKLEKEFNIKIRHPKDLL